MTFANGLARGIALTALALGSMGVVSAQNGTNYHILTNGGDGFFGGVGAGGGQTDTDGIGYFIPGEDCRGSILSDPDGAGALLPQFTYRLTAWREYWCLMVPGVITGNFDVNMPYIAFIELDGLDANKNVVFTRPICQTGITASFLDYGTGPSSTVSFIVAAVSGFPNIVLPDNGIVSATGTATQVSAIQVPDQPSGTGCWGTQFAFAGSGLQFLDNIDGIWHYSVNSPDQNQYWYFSFNEMNLTRSNTIATDAGITGLFVFPSNVDAAAQFATREAETIAILAPHGVVNGPGGPVAFTGTYYQTTENMNGGGGPNRGFDAGRGSRAISFSGLGGAKTPTGWGGKGNGAQDPAYDTIVTTPNQTKTLGFLTWDNKPNNAGVGSGRITWLGIDLAQIQNKTPEQDPDIKKLGGTVKLPVIGTGFIQGVTNTALTIFQHTTKAATSGFPDPDFDVAGSGAFGVPAIAGGSIQFNVGPFVSKIPCAGAFPVNLTYGTTGKDHTPPPALTWDPAEADISGSKEIYLWK